MKTYDIKRRNLFSIGPHTLGLIFIAVGVFTILSPLFITDKASVMKAILVGSGAVLFGVVVVLSYGGTLFDFKSKRYKNYYSFSGVKVGQWENLPALKAIRVFPHTFKATRSSDGIHPVTSGEVTLFKLVLYGHQTKPVLAFDSHKMSDALRDAKVLSEQFNILLDVQLSEVNGTFELKK